MGDDWLGSSTEAMPQQLRAGALAAGLAAWDMVIISVSAQAGLEALAGLELSSHLLQGLMCPPAQCLLICTVQGMWQQLQTHKPPRWVAARFWDYWCLQASTGRINMSRTPVQSFGPRLALRIVNLGSLLGARPALV